MDVPPIRERIIQDFGEALGKVPGVLKVARGMLPSKIEAITPALIYWCGRETKNEDSHYGTLCWLELTVLLVSKARHDLMSEVSRWVNDVEYAVMRDPTRDHLAFHTWHETNEVYAGDIAEPDYTIEFTFVIQYPHAVGDPSTQPEE
jgi:hypothetical protein